MSAPRSVAITHLALAALGVALTVGALFASRPGSIVMLATGVGFAVTSLVSLRWWK